MLGEEARQDYMKASAIAKKIMKFGRELVQRERGYLKIAETIEAEIRKEGAKPAFPVNVSANGSAAHDTPEANDARQVRDSDLVKVDFGVLVDGYAIDTAFSYSLSGEHAKLIEAAGTALQNALGMMKAGVNARDVGEEIQGTIKGFGFVPVENLCGHSLEQFNLHAGIEIPNVPHGSYELKEGDVFAVEPFATTGAGRVNEGDYCQIWSLEVNANPSVRLPKSRELLTRILAEHQTMPFAARWFKDFPMLNLSIRDLEKQGILHSYPVLKEARREALVAQAETTLIVEAEGVQALV